MSFCFNLACPAPQNPDVAYCQACGQPLLRQQYRATRAIGQGGFGRTLLAVDLDRQAETADYFVVIKQLPKFGSAQFSPTQPAAFAQEVELLRRLVHPQIPKLLGQFEDETAQYLVQQFVAGPNLETLLAETVFTETQVRQLLAEILPVLRFVHQQQVVHRDLKPANIIRHSQKNSQKNSQALAPLTHHVLVDFGAAKALTGSLRTGTSIGSAGYVAPEQAMGRATFASDLYSLGVTCIHLLTGLHPFDLYSVSEDRWVWRQFLTQPVSIELRRVLDKLLQRATSQRYSSVDQVLQALRLEPAPEPLPEPARADLLAVIQTPVRTTSRLPSAEVAANWHCQTLTGHQGAVTAIALSPDGQMIASGSSDRSIRLWSLEGKLLQVWAGRSFRFTQGHADRVTALAFSPNSQVLVSGSADGSIKQWDLHRNALFSSLPGHGWGISTLALSPDAPRLVSGSEDGLIQVWDLEQERLLANLVQLYEPITGLTFTPSRNLWSSSGQSICGWNLSNSQLLSTLKGHAEGVSALALDPSGCTLISGGGGIIKLWNLATSEQQKVIAAHRDRIRALAVHPHGNLFASGSEDGTVKLWDLWTGRLQASLKHGWGVGAIGFSPDGQLVSGSTDETVRIWREI